MWDNKYEFLEQIDEGSFGTVYKARDSANNTIVAVKVLKAQFQENDGSKEEQHFHREVDILKKLTENAPNAPVMNLIHFSYHPTPYIVMPLYDCTLSEAFEAQRLDDTNKQIIVYGVIRGLEVMSDLNLVHRDIKTSNILLNVENEPVITDFGLSRELEILQGQKPTENIGNVLYQAPETFIGKTTIQSDIYSFGVFLLAMVLEDEPTFPSDSTFQGQLCGENIQSYIKAVCYEQLRPIVPSFVQTDYPLIFDLIRECWDQNPSNRPTATEIAEKIENEVLFEDCDSVFFQSYVRKQNPQ